MKREQEEAYFHKIDRELILHMRETLSGSAGAYALERTVTLIPGRKSILNYLDKLLRLDEFWLAGI